METSGDQQILNMSNDIRVWVEQEAIHIKAVDDHGDPVELSADEARALAQHLTRLANKVVE
jgi:hypothetical protein